MISHFFRRTGFWAAGFMALGVGALCLLYPQAALSGFIHGAENCYNRVIPTLFPFFIVTQLIMSSPLSRVLGRPLRPYLKLLGIQSDGAASALVLGTLGGFAVFSKALSACCEKKEITYRQAGVLLIAGLNAGPSFIVGGVGFLLLGNSMVGALLLASLLISSFVCAVPFGLFIKKKAIPPAPSSQCAAIQKANPADVFVDAVKQASLSSLSICGFVIFFNMLTQLLCQNASASTQYITAALLEVTTGCSYGAGLSGSLRLYAPLAALSILGLSILTQAKALLPKGVSLFPFLCSRLLHLPLSAIIFAVGLHLFPDVAVCASTRSFVPAMRFDWFGVFALLGMSLSLIFECTPRSLFTKTEK